MKTWIILLRGINVGGHNKLPMNSLQTALLDAGYGSVQTYIQSGNVVLKAEGVSQGAIQDLIFEQFGIQADVLVLDAERLLHVVQRNPFPADDGKLLHVFLMSAPPSGPDIEQLDAICAPSEQFLLDGAAFYLFAPDGIGRSKLAARAEKLLGVPATARNWNTIRKLLHMSEC